MKWHFAFLIIGLMFVSNLIFAEVPMHNPDLDSHCQSGFQWSRDTASCKQADCPSGAGRTYTDDCNCGEAWSRPFRTCYDPQRPGFVVSCVAAGAACPDEQSQNNGSSQSQCNFDRDCGSGLKCAQGQCVRVNDCLVNSDCPIDYECTNNQCVAESNTTIQTQQFGISCYDDNSCTPLETCDQTTKICKAKPNFLDGFQDWINRFFLSLFSFFGNQQSTNNQSINQNAQCRFDSDCSPICEGSKYWQRGCSIQTNSCIKTFETDCSQSQTIVGSHSFSKLCSHNGCVDDDDRIHQKKEELIGQANNYTSAMQQVTILRQAASRNCLSALSDVTNNLIVSTALIYSIPSSTADLYGATTQQIIDQINNAVSKKMSAEEYIALNCNAVRVLDTEYSVLSLKRDKVMQDASTFEGR